MPDPIRFTDESKDSARDRERRRRRQQQRQQGRRRLALLGGLVVVIAIVVLVVTSLGSSGSPTNPNTGPGAANSGKHGNADQQPKADKHGGSVTRVALTGKHVASPYGSCSDPSHSGALHVRGNKLLDANNKLFIPYGITTYGGIEYGGGNQWQTFEPAVVAQIKASREYWHANTVRFQVAEQNLFNNGVPADGVNKAVLDSLCSQVQLIRSQGQEAVISDQTEWPNWEERLPTANSVAFWKVIASVFNNDPGISFDLYNEPRLFYPNPTASYGGNLPAVNKDWIWKTWRDGGYADAQHFVGMQQLVNDVRRSGAENVIWIQGPYFDNTLGLAGQYPVHGTNLVWEVHHPALTGPSDWQQNFGYLTTKYPVVDGEWGQYSSNRPECRPQSYTMVPKYLAFLRSHNVGVLGWSLQPGAMLADPNHSMPTNTSAPGDATDPTALGTPNQLSSNYACVNNSNVGEGAGQALMDEFKQYSHNAS